MDARRARDEGHVGSRRDGTARELARELAPLGRETALRRLEAGLPTGGLAVIELATDDWRAAAPGSGRLLRMVRPKDLI